MNKSSKLDKIVDTITTDIFLSHSWAHKEFARALKDALEGEGLSVWFDEKRIKEADDMPAEINSGIERSRIFLFILSPESLRSRWCQDEVDWAAKCNKRIITVLYRPVQFNDGNQVHQVLSKPRWIDYQSIQVGSERFQEKLKYLISRITENQKYLENHRQFLIRALDWERNGARSHRLLPGGLVVEAEDWLQEWDKAAAAKKSADDSDQSSDAPTALHRSFVAESRKHERKRQRIRNSAISVGFITVSVAAIVATWQWKNADRRQKNAEVVAQSLSIEKQVKSSSQLESLIDSIRLAKKVKTLEGDLQNETFNRATLTIWEAIHRTNEHQRITLTNTVNQTIINATFSSKDASIAAVTAQEDGKWSKILLQEWNAQGQILNNFSISQNINSRNAIVIVPESLEVFVGDSDGYISNYTKNGELLRRFKAHQKPISKIIVSKSYADSRAIASVDDDKTIRLWNNSGDLLAELRGENNFLSVEFLPNQLNIVFLEKKSKVIKKWEVATFSLTTNKIISLPAALVTEIYRHDKQISDCTLSENGSFIAWKDDRSIYVANISTGKYFEFRTNKEVDRFMLSPNGDKLVRSYSDGTLEISDADGENSSVLTGHRGFIRRIVFGGNSSNKNQLLTASDNGQIIVWNLDNSPSVNINLHDKNSDNGTMSGVRQIHFSSDNKTVAVAGLSGVFGQWDMNGELLRKHSFVVEGLKLPIVDAEFSPDNSSFIIQPLIYSIYPIHTNWDERVIKQYTLPKNNADGHLLVGHEFSSSQNLIASPFKSEINLWSMDGTYKGKIDEHKSDVTKVKISVDEKFIVSADREGNLKLWRLKGEHTPNSEPIYQEIVLSSPSRLEISEIAISKDNVIAIAYKNGSILLINEDGKRLRQWSVPVSQFLLSGFLISSRWGVATIDFSPDGNSILLVAGDGSVQLWSIKGELLKSIDPSTSATIARFSSDGKTIGIADSQARIELWKLSLDDLIKDGCEKLRDYLANPTLSEEERNVCR